MTTAAVAQFAGLTRTKNLNALKDHVTLVRKGAARQENYRSIVHHRRVLSKSAKVVLFI